MTGSQISDFALQAARSRRQAFGRPIVYHRTLAKCVVDKAQDGSPLQGCLAGIHDQQTFKDGGFLHSHTSICRIQREDINFTPILGDLITLPGESSPLLVNEVVNHPINPEWRLGLSAAI